MSTKCHVDTFELMDDICKKKYEELLGRAKEREIIITQEWKIQKNRDGNPAIVVWWEEVSLL